MEFLAILCMGLAGHAWGHMLKRKGVNLNNFHHNRKRTWTLFFLPLSLLFFLVFLYQYPGWLAPNWKGYIPNISWSLLRVTLIFFGGLAFGISQALKPSLGILSLLMCGYIALCQTEAFIMSPYPAHQIWDRRGEDGSILQSTAVTCTPAALANILPYFGQRCSEKECARILNTRRLGTLEPDLLAGLEKFGLTGYAVPINAQLLKRMNRPAIVKLQMGAMQHAVAVFGRNQNKDLIYVDPQKGYLHIQPRWLSDHLADGYGIVIVRERVLPVDAASPRVIIQQIQSILQREGWLEKVTGQWDTASQNAVINFQNHFAISATGHIDPATYLLLTGPYLKKYHLLNFPI